VPEAALQRVSSDSIPKLWESGLNCLSSERQVRGRVFRPPETSIRITLNAYCTQRKGILPPNRLQIHPEHLRKIDELFGG
jgi:hypothetical protein